MSMFKVSGAVVVVGETKEIGANGFTKRELVIDIAPAQSRYPSPVQFVLKKDRCALADGLNADDQVEVEFAMDGRKWDGPNGTRFFCDHNIIKLTVVSAAGGDGEKKAVSSATLIDIIQAWAAKRCISVEAATNEWNSATSDLTKTWKLIYGQKKRAELTHADMAVIVNAINGVSQAPVGDEALEALPF